MVSNLLTKRELKQRLMAGLKERAGQEVLSS